MLFTQPLPARAAAGGFAQDSDPENGFALKVSSSEPKLREGLVPFNVDDGFFTRTTVVAGEDIRIIKDFEGGF